MTSTHNSRLDVLEPESGYYSSADEDFFTCAEEDFKESPRKLAHTKNNTTAENEESQAHEADCSEEPKDKRKHKLTRSAAARPLKTQASGLTLETSGLERTPPRTPPVVPHHHHSQSPTSRLNAKTHTEDPPVSVTGLGIRQSLGHVYKQVDAWAQARYQSEQEYWHQVQAAKDAENGLKAKVGMKLVRHANSNEPQAVVVESIFHGSCAAQSHPKIQEGDKLLSVNGRQVADMALEDVRGLMHLSQPGDILALKLQRGEMSYITEVRLSDGVSENGLKHHPVLHEVKAFVVMSAQKTYQKTYPGQKRAFVKTTWKNFWSLE